MSKAGERILEGAREMLAVAKGEQPAASITVKGHKYVPAEWQPVTTAPRDGTDCLFYSPGNKHANNKNATDPHMRVDAFSERWPRAWKQLPEAPYTHWMPLPPPPNDIGRER